MNKPGHPFSRSFVDKSKSNRLQTQDITSKLLRNPEVQTIIEEYQDNIARYAFIKSVKKTIVFRNKIILAMGALDTEEFAVLELTLFFNKKITPSKDKKGAYKAFVEILRVGEYPKQAVYTPKDKFDYKDVNVYEKDVDAIEEIKEKIISGGLKSALGDYDSFV